jgi:hypothetical protein
MRSRSKSMAARRKRMGEFSLPTEPPSVSNSGRDVLSGHTDRGRWLPVGIPYFRRFRVLNDGAVERAVFPIHSIPNLVVFALANGIVLWQSKTETHAISLVAISPPSRSSDDSRIILRTAGTIPSLVGPSRYCWLSR